MTAPTSAPPRRRPMQAAPLAAPSVVVDTLRLEAREWHAAYRAHMLDQHTSCCRGRLCAEGRRLLDEADDAGRRLMLAEERERSRR